MNHIELLGRLTKDPEIKYTPNGKVVCQLTLAVDRPFTTQGNQKETDFIPVVIWGKIAEAVGNNVTKGQRLLVEGRLQIRTYVAKDGSKKWATEVVASHCEFIEYRNKGQGVAAGGAGAGGFAAMGTIEPNDDYSNIAF